MECKAILYVRELGTRKEVYRVALTTLNEARVEKVMAGMLRQMDTNKYYIDDSEVDAAREAAGR